MTAASLTPKSLQADVTWALRSAGELGVPALARDDLSRRSKLVEQRLADPHLYLAVLGEFNSGKSMFINGLLGASLMPVAPIVTTGVAIDIVRGERTKVAVQFAAEDVWRYFPAEPDESALLDRLDPPDGYATMPAVLQAVCADHAVTPLIRGVRLAHPAPLLSRGVVLIDTPGFNSTTPGHATVAQRVAAERADMAVFVIPSYSPVSLTMAEFLTGPLAQHLDRCIFVVTKLAQVDVDERHDLLLHIARRLADCGVPEPVILPVATVAAPAVPGTSGNLLSFADLENELHRLTEAGRVRAIAATTERLVADVLKVASESIREHGERLALATSNLEKVRLRDFDDFLKGWRRAVMEDIDEWLRHHLTEVRRQRAERGRAAIVEIKSKISAATSLEAVREVARDDAEKVTRKSLEEWFREFSASLNGYEELVSLAVTRLIDDFDREYHQLAGLAGEPAGKEIDLLSLRRPVSQPPEPEFSAAVTAAQALVSAENWQLAGGMTAGAVIGTMIVPGVGTAVGAIIGIAAGSIGSSRKLTRARAEVTRTVEEVVTQVFAATEKQFRNHLRRLRAAERARGEGAAQALAAGAGERVRHLLTAEHRQREALRRRATEADRIEQEAIRRLAILQHDRGSAKPQPLGPSHQGCGPFGSGTARPHDGEVTQVIEESR
jgi:GTPase Era involved in 16S rRNA processing